MSYKHTASLWVPRFMAHIEKQLVAASPQKETEEQ